MKKTFYFLAIAVSAISFMACNDGGDEPTPPGDTTETYIDSSLSSTIWHYYSFSKNTVVGSDEGNAEKDAQWAARTDWDIAIRKMYIRTNSGTSTSVGATGGVYIFDTTNKDEYGNITTSTSFASIQNVAQTTVFTPDAVVTYAGMGGNITTSQSEAGTVHMKKNADGSIMPPVYLKAPVCIFRTADGKNYYKVEFTQYQNENAVTGHVKFNYAQVYKE